MLTELGISEEDWLATPQSVRTALMVLWKQNLLLQKQCSLSDYQLQQPRSQVTELEGLRTEVAELRERLGQNSQYSSKPRIGGPQTSQRRTGSAGRDRTEICSIMWMRRGWPESSKQK